MAERPVHADRARRLPVRRAARHEEVRSPPSWWRPKFVAAHPQHGGSIALLITSDEEGRRSTARPSSATRSRRVANRWTSASSANPPRAIRWATSAERPPRLAVRHADGQGVQGPRPTRTWRATRCTSWRRRWPRSWPSSGTRAVVLPAHHVPGVEPELGHRRHQRGAGRGRGAVQLPLRDRQHADGLKARVHECWTAMAWNTSWTGNWAASPS